MASPHNLGGNYWGDLIQADKSPSPLLEQLCLGIAQLISTMEPTQTTDLIPQKMATFYRAVGGNYDSLFLSTKCSSVSFIYQSLGCFHTLQPTANAFEPPSVPALLPHGFVRWQTIQLLLCPQEHAQFLQEAVKRFDITNTSGVVFPKVIPRESFPALPDPDMTKWHEAVSKKLEQEYHMRRASRSPRRSPRDRYPGASYRSSQTPLDPRYVDADSDYFSQSQSQSNEPRRAAPGSRRASATYEKGSADRAGPHRVHRRGSIPEFPRRRVPVDDLPTDGHESPAPPLPPRRPTSKRRPGSDRAQREAPRGGFEESDDLSSDASLSDRRYDGPRRYSHHHLSPPRRNHVRRHSHDASYSDSRRRPDSPPPPAPQPPPPPREFEETKYRPKLSKAREFHSMYGPSPSRSSSTKNRSSSSRNHSNPHQSTLHSGLGPSPIQFREYIFDDAHGPGPGSGSGSGLGPPGSEPPLYRSSSSAGKYYDSRYGPSGHGHPHAHPSHSHSRHNRSGSTSGSSQGSGSTERQRARAMNDSHSGSRWQSPAASASASAHGSDRRRYV